MSESPERSQSPTSNPPERSSPWGAALISSLFGLMLIAMGSFFCLALWQGYQKASSADIWTETPCTIIESRVEEFAPMARANMEWRLVISYRYEAGGRTRLGHKLKKLDPQSVHKARIEDFQQRFPSGAQTICYVSPQDPSEAILLKDTKAPLYTIWFPALFVVGGLGVVVGSIRKAMRTAKGYHLTA